MARERTASVAVVASPREPDPWETAAEGRNGVVSLSWEIDVRASPEALWPLLADTSDLNARLGLPEMQFEERDGSLFGSLGSRLFRHEWRELPWQWVAGKSILAERRYSRGFARAVRVRYLLADHHEGTRLNVRIEWAPRYWWCRPLLRFINLWLRKQYVRVLGNLDAPASPQLASNAHFPSSTSDQVDESRLRMAIDRLTEQGFSQTETKRLAQHIRNASNEQLFRIRPKNLANKWGMELADLLSLLLHATRSGLLRLSWDVMCPHCHGVRRESRSLGELREFGRCDICDIDFQATMLESIEVTFKVLSEIREVREVFYCSAEPAKKPHIVLQQHIAPGATCETQLTLTPGRYRLRRSTGNHAPLSLKIIDAGGADSVVWNTSEEAGPSTPVLLNTETTLTLANSSDEQVSMILEAVAGDPMALRPSELFNFQQFRDLFSEESIASGLKLEVGHQTLLFTDIVGSTRLYSELGDTKAFNLVRSHFVALQEIVGERKGVVIKTIGDATMAAFLHPEDALQAAVEIQKAFSPGGPHQVALRVSIHRGLCLAVRLDSNIDYFGNTVNYAAKMQSAAGAGEIVFSKEFLSQPNIAEQLRTLGLRQEEKPFSFPAVTEDDFQSVFLVSM